MSLEVQGFPSSNIFDKINDGFKNMSESERNGVSKKLNAVFEIKLKGTSNKEETWVIDTKNKTEVVKGPIKQKPNVTISLDDKTFKDLFDEKIKAQKAFMSGKLKVKGNIMLAQKLDQVFAGARPKAKL